MPNCKLTATYYSFVRTPTHILLMCKWMNDSETDATIFLEIDREEGDLELAIPALRSRNAHLLSGITPAHLPHPANWGFKREKRK